MCVTEQVNPDTFAIQLYASVAFGPHGISFDPSGNMYAVNPGGGLYRIAPGGGSSTLLTSNANFNIPVGVALDSSGYVWVANAGAYNVLQFTTAGVLQQIVSIPSGPGYGPGYLISIDGGGNLDLQPGSYLIKVATGAPSCTVGTIANGGLGTCTSTWASVSPWCGAQAGLHTMGGGEGGAHTACELNKERGAWGDMLLCALLRIF
jgi:streptogramin lyase